MNSRGRQSNSEYVERYRGHSPQSITERHCHGDQGKRLLSLFQEKVVAHVKDEILVWNEDRKSGIVPNPPVVLFQTAAR